MGNEGDQVNAKDLEDAVSARVRATIADILPEEEWRKLVAAEVDRFLKPQKQPDHWRTHTPEMLPSGLAKSVEKAMNERVCEAVGELLRSEEWKRNTETEIRASLVKESQGLVERIVAAAIGSALSNIGQYIHRSGVVR